MPIKNLEEIRKEIAANQSTIAEKIKTVKQTNTHNKAKSFLLAVMVVLLTLPIIGSMKGSIVFFAIVAIGFIMYRMTLSKSAFFEHNKNYANAFTLLFTNHFPEMENMRDADNSKSNLRINNFLLKYQNFNFSNKFFYSGEVNNQKITFFEFDNKSLLISIFADKKLLTSDLFIDIKGNDVLLSGIKLPEKQEFDYFPELAQYFNFYTEQKGETAQFLQANEDIFVQMTKFTKYNLAITFINNQVHCLLRGVNMDLLADVDYEVNLDDKEIADYFQQLEELSNFINLLQQIK